MDATLLDDPGPADLPPEADHDDFADFGADGSFSDDGGSFRAEADIENDPEAMAMLQDGDWSQDDRDELQRQQQQERDERDAQAAAAARQARQELISRLNEQQREAVMMPAQSALVLAAAGSGKTSVLTARIAQLITAGVGGRPVPARSIMAVTFTNKAALEMRTRLKKLLDWKAVNDLWIGTFHSLCNRILRENAQAAGLPKTFAILDVDSQEALCRGILKDMGLTKSAVKAKAKAKAATAQASLLDPDGEPAAADRLAAAGAVSEASLGTRDGGDAGEFVTPSQCAKYISSRKEAGEAPRPGDAAPTTRSSEIEQLEAVYAQYQERCAKAGLLDFQDLLTRTVSLLRTDARVRKQMQERFQSILVDEFQDTNAIQYEWLSLLKGPSAHVMAVGDDDQSIYAFRGAKPQNMALFLNDLAAKKDGTPGRVIKLEQNYRSLPHVLGIANAVIANNTDRLGKTLRTTQADKGELAELVHFNTGIQEASEIARVIHRMIRQDKVDPSEIAILYRANQQSRLFEAELNKLGVPLTVYGGFRFYERQEVKHAMAYLDLVNDVNHDIAFARVANFPPRGLGEQTVESLRQDAQLQNVSMMGMVARRAQWRAEAPSSIGNLAAQKRQVELEKFADIILSVADQAQSLQLHELVQATLDRSGLLAHYAAEDAESPSEESSRTANLMELVSAARQFVQDNPALGEMDVASQLSEYLAHVALMTSTSESDMHAKKTVSLMTVHASKGLEFDHVWVTGLEEDTFPHARAIEEDANLAPTPRKAQQPQNDRFQNDQLTPAAERPGPESGHRQIDPGGPGLQEERRLLYVAVTRARKGLTLTHSAQRLINGQILYTKPSRFLRELPQQRILLTDLTPAGRERERELRDAQRSTQPAQAASKPPAQQAPAGVAAAAGRPVNALAQMLQRGREQPSVSFKPAAAQPSQVAESAMRKEAASAAPAASSARSTSSTSSTRGASTQHAVAMIGTAGRDKSMQALMTPRLWLAMLDDARARLDDIVRETGAPVAVLSGGAAWADHLAVALFLEEDAGQRISGLTLHLPAPLASSAKDGFEGPDIRCGGSSGSAATWYHQKFSRATGLSSIEQLHQAIARGATVTTEPAGPGYGAMMRRNEKIAREGTHLLAYTWAAGDLPDDGGTADTWSRAAHAKRQHISLATLSQGLEQQEPQQPQRMRA